MVEEARSFCLMILSFISTIRGAKSLSEMTAGASESLELAVTRMVLMS